MSWDVPTELNCPECGQTMFKKSGRGKQKAFCINEKCGNFLPEDQRGYYKKKDAAEGETEATAEETTKKSTKKTAKKTTKKTAAGKKPAAKKKSAKKTKEAEA